MILATHGIVGSQIVQFVPTFEFSVKTDNAGVSATNQFRMPLTTSTGLNMNVDWGDGSPIENITNHTLAIHTYATAGTYTIKVTGSILGWQFNNGGDKLKMLDVKQWSGLNISVPLGFFGCTNMTCTATDAPIITSTSLNRYFQSCTNFNGEVGNWNVSNVNIMSSMFEGATNFNRNIGYWDTTSLISGIYMFAGASLFNNGNSDSIKNWIIKNTGTSVNFQNMFFNAISFNQPIGSWDVSNVAKMKEMFRNATAFNQDISDWNVSNVVDIIFFMEGKTAANYSAQNLASIYNKWSQLTLKPNLSIDFSTIDYCDTAEANKQSIVTNFGWTITDGNAVPC